MRDIYTVIAGYFLSLTCFVFGSLGLVQYAFPKTVATPTTIHYQNFKALPNTERTLPIESISITRGDVRVAYLTNFFKAKRSVLAEYSQNFIEAADQHKMDYRLLPAIAIKESGGGRLMPKNSHNPFGYGLSDPKTGFFDSFEEAISSVAAGFKKNYIGMGLTTPELIMPKYTGNSSANNTWASDVARYMNQIN